MIMTDNDNDYVTITTTRYSIVVSTGAEINKPGAYALYLVVTTYGPNGEILDIDGAASVLSEQASDPDMLDIDAAVVDVSSRYGINTKWVIARQHDEDQYGGYTVASTTTWTEG